MTKPEFTRWLFTTLLFLLLVLPSAAAGNDTIAEVENLGDTLVFHPVTEFHELILTVTGPCGYQYRQVVDEGEPFFRLDETTIDGVYRFNLFRTEQVDPGVVKILQQARANFDEETPKELCREGKLPGPPQVQAAGFRVFRGEIVYDPGSVEKSLRGDGDVSMAELAAMKPDAGTSALPTKDFVINDDLIVDGSACIGFDCVNGESFGFDTIRLKENNLRIKFDDTSTAASFPRNDWQLTANESANGGASKFSIDDISGSRTPFTVEANARSHSLYVDDGGRIGSRTSTPSVELHTIDGDTPTLRLQQDGSSGFAPQTWDIAGNETNFFVRDVTNGSTLPFRIRPGAPSSAIFIDVDGDVGLGTSSPDAAFDIEANGPGFRLTNTGSFGGTWEFLVDPDSGRLNFEVTGGDRPVKIDPGANNNLFRVGTDTSGTSTADTVSVNGTLSVLGSVEVDGIVVHADYVFDPDYALQSIEEHASFMWKEKHLPALPKAPAAGTGPVDLVTHQMGILEELEKAHIYIEQLNASLKEKDAEVSDLRERLSRVEELLAALEGSE